LATRKGSEAGYAPIKPVQLTKFEGERWMPLGDPVEGN
jgi:hypothetical protein